ncbi:Rieske (2Fe-2S) protein [Elioraea sp.]|uniref:Rieske (2Fe-2S) protein n=1 Tax=Elioraea sp. TaxID=2185103 RepID=UPI003F7015AA
MASHVVAEAEELPPGSRKRVTVAGRAVVVFNLAGEFFALVDRCPHQGGSLCAGRQTGLVLSTGPGHYVLERKGEFIRCPWHGWEFDIRTGKSWCEPARVKVRSYPAEEKPGEALVEGPYVAETVTVRREGRYVVVDA